MTDATSNVLQINADNTTVFSNGQQCVSCNQWYFGHHICPSATNWFPTLTATDEVAELKAWIDGFTEMRKLSQKNLARIRAKLREFVDE